MGTVRDSNQLVAAVLRDLAAAQESRQSMWGYKRAAAAVLELDEPIESYVQKDGTLRKIPNVGPKSEPIILEVLKAGTSATVERAVSKRGMKGEISARGEWRENFLSRAQVLAALADTRLKGPTLTDYNGDLQMHSVWSDGSQTFESIAEAGLARGYTFSGVTDHSYGLKIANGVSMADLKKQHREIDAVNRAYDGRFRIIKGIEANILADGTVDMTPRELQQVELVVAAPHSVLRKSEDQTARMLTAVRTKGVHIIGHPRGRKWGSRPGISANWDDVFDAAAHAEVAVEIDGDPSRQDIDFELAKRAVTAGCLFALDSDAHATEELVNAETAIAHARLAGVPTERVINCWSTDKLLDWLADRQL
ncbi:MAG: PHP domain-containing protein [Phycisphaerae bacterium]|nr:PHP domain-containing protein [Gemmatimonadaceae bacterium]